MTGIIPKVQTFLKNNGATVLTCAGALGVVATAIAAVKATPKVVKILEKTKEEKGNNLTKLETFKIAAPAYIPSVLIGTATISCIFGANVLNKKQQASLIGLYSLLDSSYKNYRSTVKELYGDDADTKVVMKMMENQSKTIELNENKLLFMDAYSLQIFESAKEDVIQVEKDINDLLDTRGYVLVSEYNELLGIKSIDMDYDIGWSKSYLNSCGKDRIEFEYIKSSTENCYLITTVVEPIHIESI